MNTHDHDNDALPGDDELKSLYRSLPRKEPSPELDRAVKLAATDAVRATRRRVSRWPVAVASAAMVVVAAGLGWRMLQQPSSVPQMTTASSVPAYAPAPTAAVLPAPAAPVAPASQPLASTNEPAAPLAGRPAQHVTPTLQARQDNIRSAMKARVMAPAPPPPPPPVEASAPALPAPEENIVAAPPPAPAPSAPPAPPVLLEAAPAPMATSSYASTADSIAAAPVAGMPARTTVQATTLRAMAPAARMQPAPMPSLDATAANPTDTPAQEFAKIRQLFAWHRHDEAVQRLTIFQKAHPDIPLPDDLRAQLPDHE
ncbi:hypothetical protein [Dyella telluris]|uniref:Uncharacterized protein n=1 Tax=Dyella telluris TaxID=2763498 RepID=A0A7G8Q453_9GAMM|nr:hypothetical protein [Dyella telluris]QNK01561.1 hypothetical protein H8F01_21445 [Dyella telluris]